MKNIFKFLISIVIIILLILFFAFIFYLFDYKDMCLDIAVCKEGLEINTEYGLIKINKQNCIKYGWTWEEEGKFCNMR